MTPCKFFQQTLKQSLTSIVVKHIFLYIQKEMGITQID